MRRVGGKQADGCAAVGQFLNLFDQIFGHLRRSLASIMVEQMFHVDAVDQDGRIAPVGIAVAIGAKQQAVIFDGGFGPDAADHPSVFKSCSSPF